MSRFLKKYIYIYIFLCECVLWVGFFFFSIHLMISMNVSNLALWLDWTMIGKNPQQGWMFADNITWQHSVLTQLKLHKVMDHSVVIKKKFSNILTELVVPFFMSIYFKIQCLHFKAKLKRSLGNTVIVKLLKKQTKKQTKNTLNTKKTPHTT